ncbi:hypothetical protein KGF57_004663 [Candida theae]|uniref:Uncharacterized protein n=1 Tax=Candida theae TaxID=1198502 RepID=A0AAD5FWN7_9ASCO|nr:uncharacterized protein KGF57_004663 [Candida theae]KAI5949453.1 hypothetical protein KGF57_004663 [Candida theae]
MLSLVVSLAVGHLVSALFIDTSNYSPYPPSSDEPLIYHNSTTTDATKQAYKRHPFSLQYNKLYGKQVVSCMQQVEALLLNESGDCLSPISAAAAAVSFNSTKVEDFDCQCLFMKYVDEDCFDTGLNDNGLWDLEKLDYPQCKFSA